MLIFTALYKFRNKGLVNSIFKFKRKFEYWKFEINSFRYYNRPSYRVLFFGSDSFSLPSLISLTNQSKERTFIKNVGVVTNKSSPANPVRKFAEEQQLDCHRWPIESNNCHDYDIGIVVSFGHLIPKDIIQSFSMGMYNVHASLLPRWRGAAPIIYSIMNGDTVTGVTIMKVQPHHFDIGEILAQKSINIPVDILMPDLRSTLANEGATLLMECIEKLPEVLCEAKPQNNSDATYAPKVGNSLAIIKWTEMTSQNVYNLYRALFSFKYIITRWQESLIKLMNISLPTENETSNELDPGRLEYVKKGKYLRVQCSDGQWIHVHKLAIDGKKMSAVDFNNGFLKKTVSKHYFLYVEF